MVYKRRLGPALKAALEEQLGVDPDEQVAVWEELALLREHAGGYVAMFNAAYEANEAAPTPERQARVIAVGTGMAEAMLMVTEVASKAAKMNDKLKDRFSVHDLNFVIEKMLVLHHEIVGKDHPALSRAFADAVDKQKILPSNDVGTMLHPDDTAREYDSSVPVCDDDDEDADE